MIWLITLSVLGAQPNDVPQLPQPSGFPVRQAPPIPAWPEDLPPTFMHPTGATCLPDALADFVDLRMRALDLVRSQCQIVLDEQSLLNWKLHEIYMGAQRRKHKADLVDAQAPQGHTLLTVITVGGIALGVGVLIGWLSTR